MSAIFTTNAMIMGPAKMMDLASVMLDFLAMTVPVNSKRTFIIKNGVYCWWFAWFHDFANQSMLKLELKLS